MRTLRFLLRKEFLQLRRDPAILRMLLVMPLIQLLVLSNAATFEVKRARMFVVDRDHSTISRGVVDRLAATGRFELVAASPSMDVASDAMLDRRVELIVVLPEGLERDVVRTRQGSVQLVINAEDGSAAGIIQSYAGQVLLTYAAELGSTLRPSLAAVGARAEPPPARGIAVIEVRRRSWYNADLDYRDYMVPGILVQLVTMVGTMFTALNVVREKEAGTLDQLNVTPVGRGTFITAKLLPIWCIAMFVLGIGLLVGRILFDVPMRGSLLLVFAAAAIYLVAALGIGLLISTIAETQQQAMFVSFFILMVYLLMSGLFTPVRSMPEWAQWMAQLNPVMHFMSLMRAVLLKGAQVADVARELVVLASFGVVALSFAVRQYHKTSA
jgi:ABC-2 type transport system permease protein